MCMKHATNVDEYTYARVCALYATRDRIQPRVPERARAPSRLRGFALALNLRIILSRAFAESFGGNSMRELCRVVHF